MDEPILVQILQSINQLNSNLESFRREVYDRFAKIDERFDKIDERFDKMEKDISELRYTQKEMKLTQDQLVSDYQDLKYTQDKIMKKLVESDKLHNELREDINTLHQLVMHLYNVLTKEMPSVKFL